MNNALNKWKALNVRKCDVFLVSWCQNLIESDLIRDAIQEKTSFSVTLSLYVGGGGRIEIILFGGVKIVALL